MTLYIILIFSAICVGMAISVKAFGTGGKRKRIFQDIYFSIEEVDGIGVLYTKTGEYSAVLKMENPVQKYSANIEAYYEFTHLFAALAQTLGEGYALHKQDVFVRKAFKEENGGNHEFLSESYFRYFNGRPFTDSVCYLTITQENKKSRLMSFDNKKWRDFLVKIRKVHDQLRDAGVKSRFLGKTEACEYVDRFFSMNFRDKVVSMTNFKVDDETIGMGDRSCKVYSLVDVDYANLPSVIRPYANIEVNNTSMPVDLVSIVDSVPGADCVVFNQMVFVPNQKRELALLDKKKNRHASMPNPSNLMAVEDIKRVQEVIARESKQLVYTHYNLVVAVSGDTDIQKCTNHLENSFSRMGIHISKRAYNQLELFVNSFPGNCYGMNADYDRFLTLGDAATCLMYKERIVHNEDTPLKIYYTDRQGVPVAIDITGKDLRERKRSALTEWVFPNPLRPEQPICPSSGYERMKVLLKQAGLPDIRFHDLRHTFATHALASGVDVKTLSGILGHTRAAFTLDTYTHTTGDMQKHAAEIVAKFLTDIFGEELKPWEESARAVREPSV